MSWADIKHQKEFPHIDIVDEPADYALKHGLVDDHSPGARAQIGAWRWRAVFDHRERIVGLLKKADRAIDFGGTAGPVGYGAVVVDREEKATNGLRCLYDIRGQVDVLFTSHTLEHIVDIDLCGLCIAHKVREGGHIVIQVPSWRKAMLRAENWDHHEQTFCLKSCRAQYTEIDALFGRWFDWEVAEHDRTGGNIILIGERNGTL